MHSLLKAQLFGAVCGAVLFTAAPSDAAGPVSGRRFEQGLRAALSCSKSRTGAACGSAMRQVDTSLEHATRCRSSPLRSMAIAQ